jgi:hypothetical protein
LDQQLVSLFNTMPLFNRVRAHDACKYLLRRHIDGSFLLPALASVPGANAEERQIRALTQLFKTAYDATHSPRAVVSRRKVEEKPAELCARAKELRAVAEWWLEAGPDKADPDGVWRSQYPDYYYDVLLEASEALEEMAGKTYASDVRFAVDRVRGDGYTRWLAITVAKCARILFGKDLYGITAILVSIAVDRAISPSTVKNWCCNKVQKNGP